MNGCRTMGVKVAPQSAEALNTDGVNVWHSPWGPVYGVKAGEDWGMAVGRVAEAFGAASVTPAMAKPEEATPENTLSHVQAAQYGLPNPHITLNAEEAAAMESRMAEPAWVHPRLAKLMAGSDHIGDVNEMVMLDMLAGALEGYLAEVDKGEPRDIIGGRSKLRAALSRFKAYKEGV